LYSHVSFEYVLTKQNSVEPYHTLAFRFLTFTEVSTNVVLCLGDGTVDMGCNAIVSENTA